MEATMVKMTRIVAALALALLFAFGLAGRGASVTAQTSNDEDGVLTAGEECTIFSGDSEVTITVGDINSSVSVSGSADASVSGSAGGGDNSTVTITANESGGLVASVTAGAGGSAEVVGSGGTVAIGDTSSGNINLVIEAGDTGINCTANETPSGDDDDNECTTDCEPDVQLPDTGVGTAVGLTSTSFALVGALLALAAAFASAGLWQFQRRRA